MLGFRLQFLSYAIPSLWEGYGGPNGSFGKSFWFPPFGRVREGLVEF